MNWILPLLLFVFVHPDFDEPDTSRDNSEIQIEHTEIPPSSFIENTDYSKEMREAHHALNNKNYQPAYNHYQKILLKQPCNQEALKHLLSIAKVWGLESKYRKKALSIYYQVVTCNQNDSLALFYLGRQLSWMGKEKKSIFYLKKSLAASSNNLDTVTLLVKIYIRQKKWNQAFDLLDKYPHLSSATYDRATIAFRRRNYQEAENLYEQDIKQNPEKTAAHRGLARSYLSEKKYSLAKKSYRKLVSMEPNNDNNLREYMNVRSYTNFSILPEGSYTKAKENDPDLNAPVVRDFYTYAGYVLFFPINDQWKINGRQFLYHQKEQDIYPPTGINYNAYIQGAQINTDWQFTRPVKAQLALRLLGARGYNNQVFFPFVSTTRFEPGLSVSYSDYLQILLLNCHIESFIYKNFSKVNSALLRQLYLHVGYVFRPNVYLSPELEATFDEVFYHDDIRNRRNTLNLWGRVQLFVPFAKLLYRFEQSHFRETTDDYYSFKRQFRNSLGGELTIDILSNLYVQGTYIYRWEYTMGLNQPIGRFTFQTDKQRLQSYRVIMRAGYRLKDKVQFEVEGHLFYTTLPYEDFNIRANLLWQF